MTRLQAIQKELVVLPEEERASLASILLSTLGGPDYDVRDEEVARRDEELETGAEPGITHSQLVKRLGRRTR